MAGSYFISMSIEPWIKATRARGSAPGPQTRTWPYTSTAPSTPARGTTGQAAQRAGWQGSILARQAAANMTTKSTP